VRKVQISSPKFYFFDCGVRRALEKATTLPLTEGATEYARNYESWFINECVCMNDYYEKDYSFSYLRTKDDAEIDLLIEKPRGELLFVEIKSGSRIDERHLRHLVHFSKDFPRAKLICVGQVERPQVLHGVSVLPASMALEQIFDI
jgi:predicted AAA+ superfamily ATPase